MSSRWRAAVEGNKAASRLAGARSGARRSSPSRTRVTPDPPAHSLPPFPLHLPPVAACAGKISLVLASATLRKGHGTHLYVVHRGGQVACVSSPLVGVDCSCVGRCSGWVPAGAAADTAPFAFTTARWVAASGPHCRPCPPVPHARLALGLLAQLGHAALAVTALCGRTRILN